MRPSTSFAQQQKPQPKASGCRQQPWYHFRQHKPSSFCSGEEGACCLTHPQQACGIVSTRAARNPCWPSRAPITPPTHAAEEPLWPFPCPSSPLPLKGALGTDKAGTMPAAQQPGSLLGAGAKAKQEQPWKPGRRDGLGQQRGRGCSHPPSALSSWGGLPQQGGQH